MIYAQLNDEKICIAISDLGEEVDSEKLVKINEFNEDFIYRKYENGAWSQEKYLPPKLEEKPSEVEQLLKLQKEQIKADADRIEFLEELITELAIKVYE